MKHAIEKKGSRCEFLASTYNANTEKTDQPNQKIETKSIIVVEHDEAVMNSRTVDVSSTYKDKSILHL